MKIDDLLHNSPNPAWLAGTGGDCMCGNPALERLTGLNSSQINRADWRSFLLEEDRAGATASWQASLTTGAPYHVRVRVQRTDGVSTTVDLSGFGQKDDDGTEVWLFIAVQLSVSVRSTAWR
jgi:PAS domain S-box-containing protein